MFDVWEWEQELFDGTMATFEKIKRPDTVVVFPVLPDGRILLTTQEQPGKPPFVGATGGRVDAGEDVLVAAARELLEETGYKAERFELWHTEQPVSKVEWAVYVFVAKGLTKVSEQTLDAGEKIALKPVTFDELLDIARTQEFSEREIVPLLYEAMLDSKKMVALRTVFDPQ
jgi:8-oxo-dGTP pyrophosphatase MutT (NUDIX family)